MNYLKEISAFLNLDRFRYYNKSHRVMKYTFELTGVELGIQTCAIQKYAECWRSIVIQGTEYAIAFYRGNNSQPAYPSFRFSIMHILYHAISDVIGLCARI